MSDFGVIRNYYSQMPGKIEQARKILGRPITLTEKILFSHLVEIKEEPKRTKSYVELQPDRVAMQDATAQMALLQFALTGRSEVAVPSTVHCDHLIQARVGKDKDLEYANEVSSEVFSFLKSASAKYGLGFWKPGAGIIHQVVLENYAFPGGMMIGTDSHTPNAGGLGMVAIGVGGADAMEVMAGLPFTIKWPGIIGVHLTGELSGWASAKDVILKVCEELTVKGGTGHIVEYFGPGASTISSTGKGTICNMGAEVGATTSLFPYDSSMDDYLRATNRSEVADMAKDFSEYLVPDAEVESNPAQYYDRIIEINLSELVPAIVGPHTPDLARPVSELGNEARENGWPTDIQAALIGSCTNSSYEDLSRAASIARQANDKNITVKSDFTITPGSEQVRFTVERDGILDDFSKIGGTVLANACGPCIGQWDRDGAEKNEKNSIITSFNRNFAKRADGNPNTHGFVASPEIVTAMSIAGSLEFNPLKDGIINDNGEEVFLDEPDGTELPAKGFDVEDNGFLDPSDFVSENVKIEISKDSKRLQLLEPFAKWDGKNFLEMKLLIKAKGKCTTDHISMAGPWLFYRGHLDNISNNLLTGATNFFNGEINSIKNQINDKYEEVPSVARHYKSAGIKSIVVGDENYGEGSSREHAAMEPRHLGVAVVLVKSFARIHETNLKKQGVLALTFKDKSDYDKIREDDTLNLIDLDGFSVGRGLILELIHSDSSSESIECDHTFNEAQIEWFKAGSALNLIRTSQ